MKLLNNFVVAGGLLLALGGSVTAQAATFNFATDTYTKTGTVYKWTGDDGITTVETTAWTVHGTTPTDKNVTLGIYDTGLGVTNNKDGWRNDDSADHWHTIDNSNGIDYIKLDFSEAVKIEQIVLTIWRTDGDMTLGYGGYSAGNLHIDTDKGYLQEWTIDLTSDEDKTIDEILDSQWRIFAQTSCGTGGDPDCTNDGFKLKSVTVSAVPIPAAAWLFGSALLGVVGIGYRRREIEV
ncbi:VPLPA-CTERM sorting domain-containing protein [Thiocystis violacea]|uniref:VPLPA-CTERM sorting domain-containing protein n=1 Tax=Thiocystis violacea TaxID=13725 RepID=UPI0019043D85|nr:VPLPA-CTERM sorting domain-containing protein [Thiocystis violacea]MBK1719688.1 hypothetical protein [Thiocystis violacea]